MAEEKKANNNSHNKGKRLEQFFCNTGAFGGGIIGAFIGSGVYRLGKRLGKIKGFKRISLILTKEIYLSKKISVNCPQCGRWLKGATREMIGDTGVCPKCNHEFEIKQEE